MKEIAEKTGVSVSTVSLVMNNRDAGRIKPAIARKVRRTAEKMGYKVNPMARAMRTNRTHIIGFVSEEVATTPYAGGIIAGAQDAASQRGYMMLTVSSDSRGDEEGQVAALKRYGVDGFVYAKMSNRIIDIPSYLTDLPIVLADVTDRAGEIPSVEPDEFAIGYDATKRLIDAGCERVAYVGCEDQSLPAQQGRFEGYRTALADAGREVDEMLVRNVAYNGEALAAVSNLFDTAKPDGFFCFNDARCWHVYECAARRGLTVGRDLSVIGVDNHRVFAETLSPRLTTVELPHYEMGYWAAAKLIECIEQPSNTSNAISNTQTDSSNMFDMPKTTAPMPPLDSPIPAKIHCALIEKESVADHTA